MAGVIDFIAEYIDPQPHPRSSVGRNYTPPVVMSESEARQPAKSASTATPGVVTRITEADFANAAQSFGPRVSVSIIKAFASVESGGKSGFGPEGLPIIAYEGHIFRKYTKHVYDAAHPMLSYPYKVKAGAEWRINNKDQKAAWETLRSAMELDHAAALMACSWGMFQVMGFNFKSCGYKNVDLFVDAMKAGEKGQLDAFVGFCKATSGMVDALRKRDYIKMATLYNGKDYGDYDKRIEKFHKKFGGD